MSTDGGPAAGADGTRVGQGQRVRRDVLGAEHVDRSLAQASEFTRPIQDWVTGACWGDVWARPGLDRKTRSLLNLAMLTALNRPNELSVHVLGAVRNGCTVDEIRETLLHTAPYCGAPAALDSFRVAEATLRKLDGDG